MSKPKLATVWLDGCSGCHMSILDMDERLVELSEQFDLVYSPLVDYKEFPARSTSRWSKARSAATRMNTRFARYAPTHDCWFRWVIAP